MTTWLAGQLHVPGPDLVLVVVLPQVLLQGLGDCQVTDIAVGLLLITNGTARKALQEKITVLLGLSAR